MKKIVGKYNIKYNDIINANIKPMNIYQSNGLEKHLKKRSHWKALKHIDDIANIIQNPDYIGSNPNETGVSIEYVKQFEDSFLVGVKLDEKNNELYVLTMHDIHPSKIQRRLHSGRLKKA